MELNDLAASWKYRVRQAARRHAQRRGLRDAAAVDDVEGAVWVVWLGEVQRNGAVNEGRLAVVIDRAARQAARELTAPLAVSRMDARIMTVAAEVEAVFHSRIGRHPSAAELADAVIERSVARWMERHPGSDRKRALASLRKDGVLAAAEHASVQLAAVAVEFNVETMDAPCVAGEVELESGGVSLLFEAVPAGAREVLSVALEGGDVTRSELAAAQRAAARVAGSPHFQWAMLSPFCSVDAVDGPVQLVATPAQRLVAVGS